MADVLIEDAVALSLDLEPDWLKARPGYGQREEYARRLSIVENHIEANRLAVRTVGHDFRPPDHLITLAAFAAFADARSPKWSLPDEFRQAADLSVPAIAVSATRWPWGSYETPLLKELAAAVQHFWTSYKPESAPTKPQVIAWLKARGRTLNEATAIAQLIRDPAIPDGPRQKKDRRKG